MTTENPPSLTKKVDDVEARAMFAGDAAGPVSLGQYWQGYLNKLRAGDVGSLPAILGLVVLLVVFTIASPGTFLSTFNLANLLTQAGSICVLAMGIGFVLLLGHIDLSAGVIGGVGAGVMAEMLLKGLPWYATVLIALAVGVVMGIFTGVLVSAVGIPSFVVTLATFLAYQGVLLWIIGTGGTVPINNDVIFAVSNGNMPVTLGWIVVIASIAAYAGINLIVYQRRRAANLVTPPLQVILLRIALIAILLLGATFLLSQNRSKGVIVLEGIPWIAPIVGVLLVFWTFVQNRTAFGRHVYAVGGNAEAARRAGIRVGNITIACFVISSAMAVASGIIAASRLSSVTPDAGAGNTLLYAVARRRRQGCSAATTGSGAARWPDRQGSIRRWIERRSALTNPSRTCGDEQVSESGVADPPRTFQSGAGRARLSVRRRPGVAG